MLRDSSVLRVVLARFISRSGGEAAFFVGIWGKVAYEFEGSATDIAWVVGSLGVCGLIGGAIAGALIDRFDPRRVLLGGEVLFVPVALAFVFADSLTTLILISAALGLVAAPTYTSISAFPPFITDDPEKLAKTNAMVETAGMAALISGTAAGAALAAWVDIDAIFVFDALTSLIAVTLVYGVRMRQMDDRTEDRSGGLAEIRAGFSFAYRHIRLRFYLLVGSSVALLFGLFSALEPIFFRDVLERGPETIGWVNTVFGVGLVAGTVVAGRLPEHLRSARMVLILMALNGIGSAVYVATANLTVVAIGGMCWGVVIGVFFPVVRTMLHLNSPKGMIGRIVGVSQVVAEIAKLGPLVAAPMLAAAFGVQWTMAVSGSLLIGFALLAWRFAGVLDRTRSTPVPPIGHGSVEDEPITPVP